MSHKVKDNWFLPCRRSDLIDLLVSRGACHGAKVIHRPEWMSDKTRNEMGETPVEAAVELALDCLRTCELMKISSANLRQLVADRGRTFTDMTWTRATKRLRESASLRHAGWLSLSRSFVRC
jgi:hypothetical protein